MLRPWRLYRGDVRGARRSFVGTLPDQDDDLEEVIRVPFSYKRLTFNKVPPEWSVYSSWRLHAVVELLQFLPMDSEPVFLFIEELDTMAFTQLDESPLPAALRFTMQSSSRRRSPRLRRTTRISR